MSDTETPEANQQAMRSLLTQANISQARAAELIAIHTMRPCSPRSVRAWLADAGLPSARPCPKWAVDALEAELTKEMQ